MSGNTGILSQSDYDVTDFIACLLIMHGTFYTLFNNVNDNVLQQ